MPRLNIQGDVRRRLQEHFKGFSVAVSVPEKRKFPLVVVRRTGGAQEEVLDRATLTVLVWDTTEQKAYDAAAAVSDAIALLPFYAGYAKVKETSFYSDFDTSTKSPRYHISFNVWTYLPKEN